MADENKEISNQKTSNNAAKKSSKLIIIISIVFVLVVSAMGAVIYSLLNKDSAPAERMASEGLVVNGNLNKKASEATFTTHMNTTWTFPKGQRVSDNAVIGNSEDNEYEIFFEVFLEDEQQTLLYSSPVLPIGKELDKLELDKALPTGEYPAMCTYHLIDDEDPTKEVSKVNFNVTLIFG